MPARTLKTAPTVEPITLAELKSHLRLDSVTLSEGTVIGQSIVPGDHIVASAYSLVGAAVDVSGSKVLVVLDSGANGTGGTVDVKIQESDDNVTYADWATGAFTQVTESNDNAVQKKEYTGTKRYIRVVCTVAVATCDFGVSIIEKTGDTAEDTLLTTLITAARVSMEDHLNRALITQTWYFYFDGWPDENYIKIPLPPLASVTSIKYRATDWTGVAPYDWLTLDSGTYIVETAGYKGRVVLRYGQSWPTTTLYPSLPIMAECVCGYGDTGASVPTLIKWGMLMKAGDLYNYRESSLERAKVLNKTTQDLLENYRVRTF